MTKRRDIRRSFNRGKEGARRVRHIADLLPEVPDAVADMSAKDAQDMQKKMVQTAMARMVEIRLAQMVEAALLTLEEEFEFSEEQLSRFAKYFMERTREQANQT